MESQKLYSISETARILGVSISSLRRWTNAGKIPVTRLPSGYRRFSDEQIEKIRRSMVQDGT